MEVENAITGSVSWQLKHSVLAILLYFCYTHVRGSGMHQMPPSVSYDNGGD